MTLLALLVPVLAGQICVTPPDQTAGWKRLDIPDDSPALAAPRDVEQFRVGEAGWLLERDPSAYQGIGRQHAGQTTYHFKIPKEGRRLDVRFAEDLRGAKVDAVVLAGGRPYNLLDGRRVGDAQLSVEWGVPGVDGLDITVHHHLRPVPVVAAWTIARWIDLGAQLDISPAFRVTRSLYYRHPGGRTVELCNLQGQTLTVERGSLVGVPATVVPWRSK
jgi:hypothetical protein